MFELYDSVRIKSDNILGIIVDISKIGDKVNYVVESKEKNIAGGYGGIWKLFDCSEGDIIKV